MKSSTSKTTAKPTYEAIVNRFVEVANRARAEDRTSKLIQFDETVLNLFKMHITEINVKGIHDCMTTFKRVCDIETLKGTDRNSIEFKAGILSEQEEILQSAAKIKEYIEGSKPLKAHIEFELNLSEWNLAAKVIKEVAAYLPRMKEHHEIVQKEIIQFLKIVVSNKKNFDQVFGLLHSSTDKEKELEHFKNLWQFSVNISLNLSHANDALMKFNEKCKEWVNMLTQNF